MTTDSNAAREPKRLSQARRLRKLETAAANAASSLDALAQRSPSSVAHVVKQIAAELREAAQP